MDKIWLQPITTTPTKNTNMNTYFENLIIKLYILYILNRHIKFCVH